MLLKMPKYPHSSLNSVPICREGERLKLGDRWKPMLNRFVLLLKTQLGYERLRDEGDRSRFVYEKSSVAVAVTRKGIPVIRGLRGKAPAKKKTKAILDLWEQVKAEVA